MLINLCVCVERVHSCNMEKVTLVKNVTLPGGKVTCLTLKDGHVTNKNRQIRSTCTRYMRYKRQDSAALAALSKNVTEVRKY